jgi:hypothetical protein
MLLHSGEGAARSRSINPAEARFCSIAQCCSRAVPCRNSHDELWLFPAVDSIHIVPSALIYALLHASSGGSTGAVASPEVPAFRTLYRATARCRCSTIITYHVSLLVESLFAGSGIEASSRVVRLAGSGAREEGASLAIFEPIPLLNIVLVNVTASVGKVG